MTNSGAPPINAVLKIPTYAKNSNQPIAKPMETEDLNTVPEYTTTLEWHGEESPARLRKTVDDQKEQIQRQHKEIVKYRTALNRIAHPKSWGVKEGHHQEIARVALVIGKHNLPDVPNKAWIQEDDESV